MAKLQVIKEIIRERNLTIGEVAQDIGLTEQGFHKLIRENSTKIETLELIARKLKVSISTFFDDDLIEVQEPRDDDFSAKELMGMMKTQLEVIASQQRTIETMSKKGGDATGNGHVAPAAAQG